MSLGGEGWMRDEFPERYHEHHVQIIAVVIATKP